MKTRDEVIKMLDEVYNMPTSDRRSLNPKTIIDPDMSVNWNIKEVERINSEIDEERKLLADKQRSELRIVLEDVFDYMRDLLDEEDPSPLVLKYIYDQAYTDGHHAGMHEIFNHLDNYIEFVNDLDKLRQYGEAVRTDGEGAEQCPLGIKF